MNKLLIIGAGMATAELLKHLVRNGYKGSIEVIGEEPISCYNRILLSSMLSGEKTGDDLLLIAQAWYKKHSIKISSAEKVIAIDIKNKVATTSNERSTKYDQLVFATGSKPYFPGIPGIDAENVLGFRNNYDLERIEAVAKQNAGASAVLIGGGLLGLEAAAGLHKYGLNVTVLNRGDWLMQRQLDAMGGLVLQQYLQDQGMHFRVGTSPKSINEGMQGQVEAVTLDNGEALKADLVLVTAGIVPNILLAQQAGVPCHKGVLVNGLLQTEINDVYALGECCELDNELFGLIAPIKQQAKILAALLCDLKTEVFVKKSSPVQLKISGIDVLSSGQTSLDRDVETQVLVAKKQNIYRRLFINNNYLLGYILIGDRHLSSWYDELIAEKVNISEFRENLMFGVDTQADLSVGDIAYEN